jgi:hypothetical protein
MIRWGADFGLMPSVVEPEALFFAPSLEALPAYVTAP